MPHLSHRSAPPSGSDQEPDSASPREFDFETPTLGGIALLLALLDPGDEILLVRGAASYLSPLAQLLGARCRTIEPSELWGAIGPRTRVAVLEPDEESQALLSETDVLVVLQLDGQEPALEDFDGLALRGSRLLVGGGLTGNLPARLARHQQLLADAKR